MKNVSQELGEAHLVISRAGAMSVAEITAAGRPAIYIPLHIAGAHQQWNCERQVALGAAQIVEQRGDFHDRLRESVLRLLTNPAPLSQMAESAVRAAQVSGESAAHAVAQGVLTVV
jgi:UDP-N-acetylglucosamine--N-acetylmuramyl-(pentapeptide) pyrophosphoryl-undecaprenol N-acetylglucosamine transferase